MYSCILCSLSKREMSPISNRTGTLQISNRTHVLFYSEKSTNTCPNRKARSLSKRTIHFAKKTCIVLVSLFILNMHTQKELSRNLIYI